MNTKTQKLVKAGYALAKGLDTESAKLVKELADELAVQRVRADELNKQVVNLAVENSTIKTMNDCLAEELRGYESDGAFDGPDMHKLWYSHAGALPATGTMLANIQAQGVEKLSTFAGKEYQRAAGDKTLQRKWKGIVLLCTDFASQLRKESTHD